MIAVAAVQAVKRMRIVMSLEKPHGTSPSKSPCPLMNEDRGNEQGIKMVERQQMVLRNVNEDSDNSNNRKKKRKKMMNVSGFNRHF